MSAKKLLLVCLFAASAQCFPMLRRVYSAPAFVSIECLGTLKKPYIFPLRWDAVLAALHNPAIRGWCKTPKGPMFCLRDDGRGGIQMVIGF